MNIASTTSFSIEDKIRTWDNLGGLLEQDVEEFNVGIQEIDSEEKLNPSDKRANFTQLVDKVTKNMNKVASDFYTLHTELIRREKNLNEKECCCVPTSISGAFYAISALNCCANVVSSLGNILTFAAPNPTLRLVGLVVGLSADSCSFFSEGAQNMFYMQKDEISRISKLNQSALDNARKFQAFLEHLTSINQEQTHLLNALEKHSNPLHYDEETIDPGTNRILNRKIRACVKKYEDLPEEFRRPGVCGRLVLQILEGFPPNDPLYKGLKELAEIEDIKDLPLTLQHFNYANPRGPQNRAWTFEEGAREDNPREQSIYTQDQIIGFYKEELMERFGLDEYRIEIANTGKGFKVKIEDPPTEDPQIAVPSQPNIGALNTSVIMER